MVIRFLTLADGPYSTSIQNLFRIYFVFLLFGMWGMFYLKDQWIEAVPQYEHIQQNDFSYRK